MKSGSAHCIRGCTPGRRRLRDLAGSQRGKAGAIEPAWKCREGSWPRVRSSELTDQAVTIRDSSYQETHSGLDSTRMVAVYSEVTVLVSRSGRRVFNSCSQVCPPLCACREICALSPGKGAELQLHAQFGAGWWLAGTWWPRWLPRGPVCGTSRFHRWAVEKHPLAHS